MMRPRARGPAGIAFVVVLSVAVAALTGTIFTITVNLRDLARDTDALVSVDATIQATLAAGAEVAAAVGSGDAEEPGPAAALAGLEARFVELAVSGVDLERTTEPRVKLYADLGRTTAELTGAGDEPAAAAALADFQLTGTDLLFELGQIRSGLEAEVRDRHDLLELLGSVALALAAVVIPTVGVFMFNQVTRRRRETLELAHDLSVTRSASTRRGELFELTAHRVATALDESVSQLTEAELDGEHALVPGLLTARQHLDDLEAMARFNGSGLTHQFTAVPVLDILDDARSDLGIDLLELTAVSRDEKIWADADTTAHAMRALLRIALDAEPKRLVATTGTDSQSVHCLVTYDGELLDPQLVHLLFEERIADDIWDSIDDPQAFRLVMARTLLETAGARVMYRTKRGANQFHLRFPAPVTRTLPDPRAVEPEIEATEPATV